jgi:hypothetical protein
MQRQSDVVNHSDLSNDSDDVVLIASGRSHRTFIANSSNIETTTIKPIKQWGHEPDVSKSPSLYQSKYSMYREPLLKVKIEIEHNRFETLMIYKEQDMNSCIREFCEKYNVSFDKLVAVVQRNLKEG